MAKDEKKVKGLGGWLIVLQIFLWLFLLVPLLQIINGNTNDLFGSPKISLALEIIEVLFIGYLLFLMYSHSRKFRTFSIAYWGYFLIKYIILAIINTAIVLTDPLYIRAQITTGLAYLISQGRWLYVILAVVIPMLALTIGWIVYFVKSKRVKNTFVK